MQVNDREMYGSGCKVPGECMGVGAKYHGELSGCKVPGECRGMSGKRTVVGAKCQGNARECMCGCKESTNAGECTGIPGKRKWVGAMCKGNLGECQGNVWEWVQSARGMERNPMRMYGSGYKLPGECMGMGVGAKCLGNAGECRGMQRNAR